MDIFSAPAFRISPLAKQAFGEKQKFTHTSETATEATRPEKKGRPKEAENQAIIQPELQKLKHRDRQVRTHEAAHITAGGSLIRGSANFKYQQGADGVRYAVGGDVSIDVSKGRDPYENLQKARVIQRAALAPANPSATDHTVAAQATQMAAIARIEIARLNREQGATPAQLNTSAGVAQYQRMERETGAETYQLNEYA
ncbi:MAG: hypothetical protein L3J26_10545 [Candidatus Polarisedimenticolaceae bacterium]|nr:hypothetical protein [Candidatus Polarisedimenticolaceae bacterium]